MKSEEIREIFLFYFEKNHHKRVLSSSLIPSRDPTLLFTNAGMNQFKELFLGNEKRDYKRAVSCQKCLRAGGKHNDLDNVGITARHHTFFEMLGNFSFGDYFKKEAIEYAWDLLLNYYKLPKERLWVSIYEEDEEAYNIWREVIGLSEERIVRLGMKDNFWAMGETGPCGPCSEIYYDLGPELGCGKENCGVGCDCDRFLEFWNLVFMQFNRDENGKLHPLPSPSIDTGMGLERIVSILQGKKSNYDTDLFLPIIQQICDTAQIEYPNGEKENIAVRVIADHSRAVAFLIAAGVIPSNEGRGYVLRRIIRRASRHGKNIGLDHPFLYKIAYYVADFMGKIYPELIEAKDYISKICYSEEERFHNVISLGLSQLEELIETTKNKNSLVLPGNEVFKLYDTFGLPLDLIEEVSRENNLSINYQEYQKYMDEQRTMARAAWRGDENNKSVALYRELSSKYSTEFLGYDATEYFGCKIIGILKDAKEADVLNEGEKGELILDKTVFYGESGGQVGDKGLIKSPFAEATVEDTQKPSNTLFVHKVKVNKGSLKINDTVDLYVNKERRFAIMRNHTATHLLNAALRQILGLHVKQSGSLVSDEKLRFDFTHFDNISYNTIKEIEQLVNTKIIENLKVNVSIMPIEDAISSGALAFFDEKYQEQVRVLTINNFSKELCGGTHCSYTGQIGSFIITKTGSVAAGIKRIEAITGKSAFEHVQKNRDLIHSITELFKTQPENLIEKIKNLIEKNKELEKEMEQLKISLLSQKTIEETSQKYIIDDIKIIIRKIDNVEIDTLRELMDEFKLNNKKSIAIFGSASDGKAYIVIGTTPDISTKINAASIIKEIAQIIEGGGGGRKDFAQAGGKKPEKLNEALQKSLELIEKNLKKL
jgi:alanyl-tRNA synthetase